MWLSVRTFPFYLSDLASDWRSPLRVAGEPRRGWVRVFLRGSMDIGDQVGHLPGQRRMSWPASEGENLNS